MYFWVFLKKKVLHLASKSEVFQITWLVTYYSMSCKNSKHHHRITAAFTRICVPEMRGNVHPDPGGKKNLLVSSQICVHASLRCLTVSTQSHKTWPFKSWIGLSRASSWKMWALMSTLIATVVPERFHTSVKPKEVSELLRGHDGSRTWACFYCSGVRTAGLPQSRTLASHFLTNMWMRGEA